MPLRKQKLQKVTIKAYSSSARSGQPIGTFEAMYNPASFSQKYEITYAKIQGFGSSGRPANFSQSKPKTLGLNLILDGTGVDQVGATPLFKPDVSKQVKNFIDLTFQMNGQTHEPNYLVVEWGGREDAGLIFSCRLGSVNVTYTSFDRDGSPLRAELDIVLVADKETEKRLREEGKSSPDLSHVRVVKSGDTLPLLSKDIYGSPTYYLWIAKVNNLTNFRILTPGQELFFPPLSKDEARNE